MEVEKSAANICGPTTACIVSGWPHDASLIIRTLLKGLEIRGDSTTFFVQLRVGKLRAEIRKAFSIS